MSTYLNEGIGCRQAHYVFQTFQVPKNLTECIIKTSNLYNCYLNPYIYIFCFKRCYISYTTKLLPRYNN